MARLIDLEIAPVVILLVLGVAGLYGTEAAVYQVGDAAGWKTPSTSTFYANWAASKNFVAGDILEFNFVTNTHDVDPVTQDDYTNCNTSASGNAIRNGPANVPLTAGVHYYICTFSNHCTLGMKLAVNVSASPSSGSPTATPSPPPPPPPPSSSNSASSSSLAAALAMVFMSVVLGSTCYFSL